MASNAHASSESESPEMQGEAGTFLNTAMQQMKGILLLDRDKFEAVYTSFCQKSGINFDQKALSIDNKQIDLYKLHIEAIKEGGLTAIESKDLWSVLGGRLGYVEFPGSDNEPNKSGPGVAEQLENIYKQYMAAFDQWFILQAKRQEETLNRMNHPHQMQQIVMMSQLSADELRARGIDERAVQFIVSNRESLLRSYQEQQIIALELRNGRNAGQTLSTGQGGLRPPTTAPPFGAGGAGPRAMALNGRNGPALFKAEAFVRATKADYIDNVVPQMHTVEVPSEQRLEYGTLLESLFRQCLDTEKKLAMVHIVLSDQQQADYVKRLIIIIGTVEVQRSLLSDASSPSFIINTDVLKAMTRELARIMEIFQVQFNLLRAKHGTADDTTAPTTTT